MGWKYIENALIRFRKTKTIKFETIKTENYSNDFDRILVYFYRNFQSMAEKDGGGDEVYAVCFSISAY